jgi:ketosteroid isomerase-like protein
VASTHGNKVTDMKTVNFPELMKGVMAEEAKPRTKAEIVKGFASGAFKYEARTISDLNVRVYGETAVVTGRSVQKGIENGKDYSGDYRFTRVYVKLKGAWMTVALQTTMIQK